MQTNFNVYYIDFNIEKEMLQFSNIKFDEKLVEIIN
jgi:hypothetical protein